MELHGCVGQMFETELVIHLLKKVTSLERITFDPRARIYLGDGKWMDGFDDPCWFLGGRNLIQEDLRRWDSPTYISLALMFN